MMDLLKNNDKERNPNLVIGNNGRKRELIEILDNNTEFYEWMLLLTIIASYYTNSEKISSAELPKFTIKVINCFIRTKLRIDDEPCKWDEHIEYLRKHKKVYEAVLFFWREYLDNSGNLNFGSIKDVLDIIRKDLYGYSRFRNVDVVHGEGLRLPKNVRKKKYIRDYQKTINSMFIFPPAKYIFELIEFLDEKLKDKKIDLYKKAAYIGTVIFLTHPFTDGNSRASRISMISYLDANGKNFYRFYTFIANFIYQNGSVESYLDFLHRVIYPKYREEIKEKIKLDDEGNIIEYISIDDYIEIIEEVVEELKKRLIKIGKEIIINMDDIIKIMKLLKLYEELVIKYGFDSKEIIVFKSFLIKIFQILHENGLKGFKNDISLSKKRIKTLENKLGITVEEIIQIKEIILKIIE